MTGAVHAKKSVIFLQLWALGRAAEPDVLKEEGDLPFVSSGNIKLRGQTATPRPLTIEEIKKYVGNYATAALNAIKAGFDGVEIHSANGTRPLAVGVTLHPNATQATSSISSSRVSLIIESINMEARLKIGLDLPSRSWTLLPKPSVRIGLGFDLAPGANMEVGLVSRRYMQQFLCLSRYA